MLEIRLHPSVAFNEKEVEAFGIERDLLLSMKGALKSKAFNIHYHFKRKKERGVLEITIFADVLQINVHDNRQGDWILDEIAEWRKRFK